MTIWLAFWAVIPWNPLKKVVVVAGGLRQQNFVPQDRGTPHLQKNSLLDDYYIKKAIFPKFLLFCFCPTFFQPVLLDSYSFFLLFLLSYFFQKSTGHPATNASTPCSLGALQSSGLPLKWDLSTVSPSDGFTTRLEAHPHQEESLLLREQPDNCLVVDITPSS